MMYGVMLGWMFVVDMGCQLWGVQWMWLMWVGVGQQFNKTWQDTASVSRSESPWEYKQEESRNSAGNPVRKKWEKKQEK